MGCPDCPSAARTTIGFPFPSGARRKGFEMRRSNSSVDTSAAGCPLSPSETDPYQPGAETWRRPVPAARWSSYPIRRELQSPDPLRSAPPRAGLSSPPPPRLSHRRFVRLLGPGPGVKEVEAPRPRHTGRELIGRYADTGSANSGREVRRRSALSGPHAEEHRRGVRHRQIANPAVLLAPAFQSGDG